MAISLHMSQASILYTSIITYHLDQQCSVLKAQGQILTADT